MNKTVEKIEEEYVNKIEINSTGIYRVYELATDFTKVIRLNEQEEARDRNDIFSQNGIDKAVIYSEDINIVRALAYNKELLAEYLRICREANYPAKKVEIPEGIPEVEYDLRGLKDWFPQIEDEKLRRAMKIEIYDNAQKTKHILGPKATVKVGISDKLHIMIEKYKQSKNPQVLLLGDGSTGSINAEENDNNRKTEFRENIKVELPENEKPVNENLTVEVPEITPEHEKEEDKELVI